MSRLKLTILLLVMISGISALATPAHAVLCQVLSPKQLVEADRILLVRAGATTKVAKGFATEFHVLFAIKGKASKTFTWERAYEFSLGGASYKRGEVHLLFVQNGQLPTCRGNTSLPDHLPHLAKILTAAKRKTTTIEPQYMPWLLGAVVAAYGHDRPTIAVKYAPLANRSITLGQSKLRFETTGSKKNMIYIDQAVQTTRETEAGPLVYLSGRYPQEGIRFQVLVGQGSKRPEILFSSVVEN